MRRTLVGGVIAVDFDNTLSQYGKWTGPSSVGEPMPGAMDFMDFLGEHEIVWDIFSVRANTDLGRSAMNAWVAKYSPKGFAYLRYITDQKLSDHLHFVDDRALPFTGDFAPIKEFLSDPGTGD